MTPVTLTVRGTMRYLCFDIGDRRTGVAVGDDETRIASPVGSFEARFRPNDPIDRLLDTLISSVNDHQPDAIVLGLPLNMDGTHGPQARRIIALAEQLARRISLQIRLQDERLTSFEADQQMARSGLTHQQKKYRRDALAAAATLQDFLDSSDHASNMGHGRDRD
ncbi:MAG: Holliday junction resolvase RuvX [Planctomycetes bacterium]|nr:Holliday junction resolvase RuvX [Planctomycetota bacterium]